MENNREADFFLSQMFMTQISQHAMLDSDILTCNWHKHIGYVLNDYVHL